MKYDELISQVQKRAGVKTKEEALRAVEATLKTLAERMSSSEAAQLAAQLPPEIQSYLTDEKTRKRFGLGEFYERVSRRESISSPQVERHARAVMSVISEAVTPGEFQDILDQLPDEYLDLFTFGVNGEYRKT